ncbi:hypothetical protein AHF37_11835 [Paragonimus kellicotti]|nr:hypothetical protein AHF37_11835 [Paragonimus kellicotti]
MNANIKKLQSWLETCRNCNRCHDITSDSTARLSSRMHMHHLS